MAECFASGFAKLVTVVDSYETNSLQLTGEILNFNGNVENLIMNYGVTLYEVNVFDRF